MPRRVRLDAPLVVHHVMLRGVGGAPIFLVPDDQQDFVDRLCRVFPECGAHCFAWSLMPNHVHLVVQTRSGALSRVMQRLGTGYAVRFNRRYERRGYVFMDRFRSRIVQGDADLTGLIRYVHRNPIEGGLVPSLEVLASHAWCGHGALVGARRALPFEAVEGVLRLFDDEPGCAQRELLDWMARDAETSALETQPVTLSPAAPAAESAPRARTADLDAVLRAACAHYGIAPHELASGCKRPRIVRARSVVAYVSVVELGMVGRVVARALGVSCATVSAGLDRGRRAAREDGFAVGENEPPLRGESERPRI